MRATNTVKEVEDTVQTGLRRVANNADHMAEVASEKVKEYSEKAKEILHEANNTSLADVEKKARNYIRKEPARSVLTAAAAGFILGFIFARK